MKRMLALALVIVAGLTFVTFRTLRKNPPKVQVGLDRIATTLGPNHHDERLGLIVHAASMSGEGRHAIDAFSDAGLTVVRLLTPEHGLRSRAAAGEHVADGTDPVSGLPVISLYGDHRKPTAEDLEGLHALVFDLQGAGIRYYTYVSTLILALEAAAEADVEFIVLDRPNPLGGMWVAGPPSAPRDIVPSSFVNLAPGPLVHGLTAGEMARFVNRSLEQPARLAVVPMMGWTRSMRWRDTGLRWIPPSPNLRTPEAALLYPGTGLLEATNVSEGRGTDRPFEIFGAPWIDPAKIPLSVPGFAFEPATFTPRSSPAAPKPKFLDEPCRGWTIRITDPSTADAYRLGVTLLSVLSKHDQFEWRLDGRALTHLVGTPQLLKDLQQGTGVEEILTADAEDHRTWLEARKPILLY